jgi:hypothetical protein
MSAPAQKPRAAPVTTIARTPSEATRFERVEIEALHLGRPCVQPVGPVERDDGIPSHPCSTTSAMSTPSRSCPSRPRDTARWPARAVDASGRAHAHSPIANREHHKRS